MTCAKPFVSPQAVPGSRPVAASLTTPCGLIADTGVDYISIGAMTKDVKAVDLSMRLSI